MIKRITFLVVCVFFCIFCSACGSEKPSENKNTTTNASESPESSMQIMIIEDITETTKEIAEEATEDMTEEATSEEIVSNEKEEESINNGLLETTFIEVSREGYKEDLPAYLASGSGYFIYLFDQFVLEVTDKGDLIHPESNSYLNPIFTLLITRSDGMNPLPEDVYDNYIIDYSRIERGNQIFDITMTYSREAEGSGSNLLYEMRNTIIVP